MAQRAPDQTSSQAVHPADICQPAASRGLSELRAAGPQSRPEVKADVEVAAHESSDQAQEELKHSLPSS